MTDYELLDWRHARVADPQPCYICTRPALLRHPVNQRPCHKVCHDDRARKALAEGAR